VISYLYKYVDKNIFSMFDMCLVMVLKVQKRVIKTKESTNTSNDDFIRYLIKFHYVLFLFLIRSHRHRSRSRSHEKRSRKHKSRSRSGSRHRHKKKKKKSEKNKEDGNSE